MKNIHYLVVSYQIGMCIVQFKISKDEIIKKKIGNRFKPGFVNYNRY
jgi:hypothetical protein